jgi:hypothetical protein
MGDLPNVLAPANGLKRFCFYPLIPPAHVAHLLLSFCRVLIGLES